MHSNSAACTRAGMVLDDHYITSGRMGLLEELAMIMVDELGEMYGSSSELAGMAQEVLDAVQALRTALREQVYDEHPRSPRRLRQMYTKPPRPSRSVRPGMRRGGGSAHRTGLPS